ncbi:MAG TPA: LPS export ABC transporter permease LptF [Burkholderiales bacterium]|jgi:lipopolysaccharide export system permease protein|nr:LPS export ABC transporter permease LptF [Burkholderiales bacterium]
MIFLRSTLRELTTAGVAVFAILLVITFTSQLIRLLGSAARGRIPADAVMTLMGFAALGYLSVLLSATVFLAVLLTLTRAYRDSEMVVWQTSGLGLISWFRPVIVFAAPVVLTVAVLSTTLTPWAVGKVEQYRHQLANRDDVSAVSPGVFKESRNAERVFFVENLSSDLTQVTNIFVHELRKQRQGVVVARRGYLETTDEGDRYLVMADGRHYAGTPGQADYRVETFGRYALRIEQSESKSFLPSHKSRPTRELLADPSPANMGELGFRFGLPVATVILALLAIPMSAVNPRAGRAVNLIAAVFVFMIYSNVVSLSQAWIAQRKLPPEIGVWIVHAVMVGVLAVLLARRMGRLRIRLRRR